MTKLILMRHGQSIWNLYNRFTGWVDVPLSQKGIDEALEGGSKLHHLDIDIVFTSTLIRAQMTALLALLHHPSKKVPITLPSEEEKWREWAKIYGQDSQKNIIPVIKAWQLNERMYGELQGLNKQELIDQFGLEQVQQWRRSFDIPPPQGESLKMTAERTLPYFEENILPQLSTGNNVFVSAHGNSLRSIIMKIEGLTKEEVIHLELTTGEPIIYSYDQGLFQKTQS